VGDGGFDEQRALADVAPAERERLLRAQAGVGQDADEDRVARFAVFLQPRADLLDGDGRGRRDGALGAHGRLARRLDRVRRYH